MSFSLGGVLIFWLICMSLLAGSYLVLTGEYSNNSINLSWNNKGQFNTDYYEVEKSVNGTDFNIARIVHNSGLTSNTGFFTFIDEYPGYGNIVYRFKAVIKAV